MNTKPEWLIQLLKCEITDRIVNDARSVPGTWLGWPKEQVFWQIIGGGQAEFNQAIGHLSPGDRALLYAMYNQPRHLDELFSAFSQLLADSTRVVCPTLIDIGCGPCTAGLALAAALGNGCRFRYFGVDRADSMLGLGQHLFDAAQDCGGIAADSVGWFGNTLDEADFGQISGDLTIVVLSYLFASETLDIGILSSNLRSALTRIGLGPVAVLYTNSAQFDLNTKFPIFKQQLEADRFVCLRDDEVMFHATKNPKPIRYALFFRKAITTLTL